MTPEEYADAEALVKDLRAEVRSRDYRGEGSIRDCHRRAVQLIERLLAERGQAEVEWEYGLLDPQDGFGEINTKAHLVSQNFEHVRRQHRRGHPTIQFVRRRKAGPWEVIDDAQ